MQYSRILLTDDGSPLAASAAPYAAAVARTQDAELLVLRVTHGVGLRPEDVDQATWTRAMSVDNGSPARSAQPFLRHVMEDVRARGAARVGALVVQGEPASAIAEVARRVGTDLVVMASHGYSGIRRAILGSVTDYVARHVGHIPVLVCSGPPPAERDPFARIAVALDETPFAEAALEYARALSRGTGGSVALIRVLDADGTIISTGVPWSGEPLRRSTDEAEPGVMVRGRRPIDPAHLVMPGLHLEPVPDQDVGSGILGSARSMHCGVIVISTHERDPIGRFFRGSVGDQVARLFTGGAVLLVHPELAPRRELALQEAGSLIRGYGAPVATERGEAVLEGAASRVRCPARR